MLWCKRPFFLCRAFPGLCPSVGKATLRGDFEQNANLLVSWCTECGSFFTWHGAIRARRERLEAAGRDKIEAGEPARYSS
jgi:hypothetical protein